jgi:hypothetical protein
MPTIVKRCGGPARSPRPPHSPQVNHPMENHHGLVTSTQTSDLAEKTAGAATAVSVVIPLLNEADSLPELGAQLQQMMDNLERSCEIIFVDDGSSDDSFEVLRQITANDSRLRRSSCGAISDRRPLSRLDLIMSQAADHRHSGRRSYKMTPRYSSLLLDKIDEGYDIVSGWRVHDKING